jgi:undecaprenyl-phosphate 4-deoxy-4-formamido-L-arabinose transferase
MELTKAPDAATARPAPPDEAADGAPVPTLSIVVPVYQGERTLEGLVREIEPLTAPQRTPQGAAFRVAEVILVHDGAIDNSDRVMDALAAQFPFVRLIWLSRNYGQHPATLAGMASTTGDWIVTMDEDGQQNPADIGRLLDRARETGSQLVYALPSNPPPHGWLRNRLSDLAKFVFTRLLASGSVARFNSFRLVDGEIGRSLAAYCGNSVYLDVALSWTVARSDTCPVVVRGEGGRPSGYNFRKLLSHFARLVLTSGTRPLRFISLMGCFSVLLAIAITATALYEKWTSQIKVEGWTSTIIVICFFAGCILLSLGIIAEYLGTVLTMSMGKPLYLVVSRPRARKVVRS